MADRIQFRRDTLANWTKANPILLDGEVVLIATDETKPQVYDSKKVGDGVHAFNDLEMLGYECLQELGDSTVFPVSQKAVTLKLIENVLSNPGENICNPKLVLDGCSVREDGSVTSSDLNYGVALVLIGEEGIYVTDVISNLRFHALYDENLNYIEGTATQNNYIPYVKGAKYAKCSVYSIRNYENVMINKGNKALPFKNYNPVGGYLDDCIKNEKSVIDRTNIKDDAVNIQKTNFCNIEYFKTSDKFDYSDTILELYINPDLIPSGEDLCGKQYDGVFYVRPKSLIWNARVLNIASLLPNKVYPIICHKEGNGVNIGDIVGYVVFKNISKLLLSGVIDGGAGELLYDECKYLLPWGKIKSNDETINGGKIEDKSISKEKLNFDINSNNLTNGVKIFIPDEIIAVEDDTLQIFWRSVVHAFNPYIFDIQAICSVGKSYPRYFTFKPSLENVGKNYSLNITIRDNNLSVITQKSVKIKVVGKTTNPSSTLNILCIGASATANGQWAYEFYRRLTSIDGEPLGLGLTNVKMVGRKIGYAKNIKLEATGGWRVQDYASQGRKAYRFVVKNINQLNIGDVYTYNNYEFTITEINVTEGYGNIRCTYEGTPTIANNGILTKKIGTGDGTIEYESYQEESYNPFWNNETNKLDFKEYADNYCDGNIGLQVWHCGVNDIANCNVDSIELAINSFDEIIKAYHSDFPDGKIIISSVPIGSPNGGFAANYGAANLNYFSFLHIAQLYAEALEDLCKKYSEFVFYSPVLEEFDAENSYPTIDTNVNNRNENKEKVGTNAVHPIDSGSYLVSDSIYRTFSSL